MSEGLETLKHIIRQKEIEDLVGEIYRTVAWMSGESTCPPTHVPRGSQIEITAENVLDKLFSQPSCPSL